MADSDTAMAALMSRLYTNLTDADDHAIKSNERERFISWCLPGIPLDEAELRFATQGLVGVGADAAAQGKDTALLLGQASRFARLVDFTADATAVFSKQKQIASFQSDAGSLTRTYQRVLDQSQVVRTELDEKDRATLERFRDALYPEQEVTDLVTGEKAKTRVEGPLLKAYKEHQAKYELARYEFTNASTAARIGASPEAVLSFSLNGDLLRRRVMTAEGEWAAAGHRTDVERMLAVLDQIGQRDMSLWKADVKDRFERGRQLDAQGQEFWWTSLTPGNFVSANAGWSEFEFKESDIKQFSQVKNRKWDVGGKIGWGLNLGGGAEGSSSSTKTVKDVTNLSVKFRVAQIPLEYPWLDEYFLNSRAWRFAPDAVEPDPLSDGGEPPDGSMVAYPTGVIFIRDVCVNFEELHDATSEISKAIKGKGSIGWGGLGLGGSYSRDEQTKTLESTLSSEGLKIGGLQIIGFRCHLFTDPVPNPLEDAQWIG